MDMRKTILYAAFALVAFSLWQAWQHDYPNVETVQSTYEQNGQGLPELNASQTEAPRQQTAIDTAPTYQSNASVEVKTDVIHFNIDLKHGEITQASLLQFPQSLEDKAPIQILNVTPAHQFVAKNQLVSSGEQGLVSENFNFKTAASHYELKPDEDELSVRLEGENQAGLKVIKTYRIKKGSYLIQVDYQLENRNSAPWKGYLNTQLVQSTPPKPQSSMFQIGTYIGASYSEPGVHRYEKVSFDEMHKHNLDVKTTGGWIAMQQHYFLTSWIPESSEKSLFYTRQFKDTYTIGTLSDPITLAPNTNKTLSARLYVGPEETDVLKTIAPGLDLTVDYGWFWFISSFIFSMMKWIYELVGNWGWSIIFVTILIKLAFYRLSASSYRSMAGMRQIQPKLQALKDRYGDDKAKLSQATMELYKQEKINPFGGCLPIVIQIPVFIALYWVLIESVSLRQAPFILWIHDLAAPDPYHVLPIIMGLSMLLQQRLNPAPPDPMQAKMMMFLPVLFTGLFWNFPSGLVLYWIVNNVISILQQWWITKRYETVKTKPAHAK